MTSTTTTPLIIGILHHFGDVVLEVDREGYVLDVWVKPGYVHSARLANYKGHKLPDVDINPATIKIAELIKQCIDTGKDQYYEYSYAANNVPAKHIIRVVALHADKDKAYVVSENVGVRYGIALVEDKWKMALDAAGDGMYDSDMTTGKIYFSDKWHEIFGYAVGEITDDGSSWGALIHPDDLAEANKNFEDYLSGKKSIYQAEFRYRCKDGSYKWILSRGVVVSWTPEGKPARLIGTHKDIHERKMTEMALAKALENEKELGQLKSKFISLASHEFRTPLSTILSSAYLASKYAEKEDQPKRDKHIQRIVSSVTTLTDILNDFLSVGRLEEGRIQVRYTEVNVKAFTKQIINEISTIQKKGQHIFFEHMGDDSFYLDITLYKHIVINLLSNAIKFSAEETAINVKTSILGGECCVSVKDSGIGISDEDRKNLFERFFRGRNVGNIQGTGLGLHIVSKYAELMNGSIECKSEINKGTEFIICFKNNVK